MPIHKGIDSHGHYFQWGNHGAKYYYQINNKKSIDEAYDKALKQMHAIYWSGYHSS